MGDISTRAKSTTGVDEARYYVVQDGSAGSIYLSMMVFPKILVWADGNIDQVILRHDVNYKDTRMQEFQGEASRVTTSASQREGRAAPHNLLSIMHVL